MVKQKSVVSGLGLRLACEVFSHLRLYVYIRLIIYVNFLMTLQLIASINYW